MYANFIGSLIIANIPSFIVLLPLFRVWSYYFLIFGLIMFVFFTSWVIYNFKDYLINIKISDESIECKVRYFLFFEKNYTINKAEFKVSKKQQTYSRRKCYKMIIESKDLKIVQYENWGFDESAIDKIIKKLNS